MGVQRLPSQLTALPYRSRYYFLNSDFDIGLTYIIQLFCSKGYLSVLIEKTYFDRFDFRPVEGFKIKDAKLAQFYAK